MKVKTDDILAIGLIILSIALFLQSINLNNNYDLLILISSIIIFLAEIVYIIQKLNKGKIKWLN